MVVKYSYSGKQSMIKYKHNINKQRLQSLDTITFEIGFYNEISTDLIIFKISHILYFTFYFIKIMLAIYFHQISNIPFIS